MMFFTEIVDIVKSNRMAVQEKANELNMETTHAYCPQQNYKYLGCGISDIDADRLIFEFAKNKGVGMKLEEKMLETNMNFITSITDLYVIGFTREQVKQLVDDMYDKIEEGA